MVIHASIHSNIHARRQRLRGDLSCCVLASSLVAAFAWGIELQAKEELFSTLEAPRPDLQSPLRQASIQSNNHARRQRLRGEQSCGRQRWRQHSQAAMSCRRKRS
jgi:hypothetical protein